MATILQLRARYERLDATTVAVEALGTEKDNLVEYNQAQMYGGEDAKGGNITPEYTALTVFLKTEKGQPTDRVTLYDTGAFYEGMYAEVRGDTLEQGSRDRKTQKIEKKYGKEIWGLNVPYKAHFIQNKLRPTFMGIIRRHLGS